MLMKSISVGVIALVSAGMSVAANRSTFEDLQSTTSAVRSNADKINAIYNTTGYDWNAEHVQAIRDETNRIGRDLQKLQGSPLTPTEQKAVNRALPILQTMAADANAAIRSLDVKGRPVDNNGALFNEGFHNRMVAVEDNAAKAEQIFRTLRNYEGKRGPLESLQAPQDKAADQPSESAR